MVHFSQMALLALSQLPGAYTARVAVRPEGFLKTWYQPLPSQVPIQSPGCREAWFRDFGRPFFTQLVSSARTQTCVRNTEHVRARLEPQKDSLRLVPPAYQKFPIIVNCLAQGHKGHDHD